MYNSSRHTFGKQDKPNIRLESYHFHINQTDITENYYLPNYTYVQLHCSILFWRFLDDLVFILPKSI